MMNPATLAILTTFLIDSTLRATVILGVALGVTFLLKRHSAALRHLVLSLAIAGALLAPLLTFVAPAWRPPFVDRALSSVIKSSTVNGAAVEIIATDSLHVPSRGAATTEDGNSANAANAANAAAAANRANAANRTIAARAASVIIPLWIAGAIVFAGILLTGLARLRWLASRSRLASRDGRDEALAAMVEELALASGVTRPVALLWNEHSYLLVTWGHFRPRIMLPAAAAPRWSDDRLRVVISHELAHVRRGDWITQLAAESLRAVFWFNPLVWIACRRLRAESELACDDEVINGGIEGVDYAGHLLDLARVLNSPRHAWLSAPAMARPSSLEGRISAMLNAGLNRHPVTRAARTITCALVLGLTLAVAGFAQSTFHTFSGTIVDSTDRVVPGAELTLTNPARESRHVVKTDANGRFEFIGLPSADYGLEVTLPGFKAAKEMVAIANEDVLNRRIALQVGTVTEQITVANGVPLKIPGQARQPARPVSIAEPNKVAASCKPSEGNVGGSIKPPTKTRHVAPIYPEDLSAAGIGGIVSMEALIDTEGNVQDVTVLNAPDPGLGTAASESVMQWKYTPTLLNCAPIEVRMGVTVSFVSKAQQ